MLVPESIKATSVKENSLLITKAISVCHFWKITLSIKLKKFYLLLSKTSFSKEGGFIMGLESSFKFIIYAIFCSFMSVELSSLISCFTIFTFVIKSCRVTGFISTSSCFFFVFSFLSFSFSFLTFSYFPHFVTWCPYFLHLIKAIGMSIESFNFSK